MGFSRIGASLGVVLTLCMVTGCGTDQPGQALQGRSVSHTPSRVLLPSSAPRPTVAAPRGWNCLTWGILKAAAMGDEEQQTYLADAPEERSAIKKREAQAPDGTHFMVSQLTSTQVRLYMTLPSGNPDGIVRPLTGLVMVYQPPLRRYEPENSPPGYYSIAREVIALDGHGRQVQDYYVTTGERAGLCGTTLKPGSLEPLPAYPYIESHH